MSQVFLAAALFALFIAPASATAQALPISAGDRIRLVRIGMSAPQEFTVVALRADTLHLRAASGMAVDPITLDGVHRLDVYRGRSRSSTFGRRVLIGAGIGALAGGVLVAVTDDDDFFADSEGGQFAIGALGGAAVGGAIGAMAGLSGRTGYWETVLLR